MTSTGGKELPNQGLLPTSPDAAHSIPGGLLCLLSWHAAEPHVRLMSDQVNVLPWQNEATPSNTEVTGPTT